MPLFLNSRLRFFLSDVLPDSGFVDLDCVLLGFIPSTPVRVSSNLLAFVLAEFCWSWDKKKGFFGCLLGFECYWSWSLGKSCWKLEAPQVLCRNNCPLDYRFFPIKLLTKENSFQTESNGDSRFMKNSSVRYWFSLCNLSSFSLHDTKRRLNTAARI